MAASGVAVGLGVNAGTKANKRTHIPPHATPHPGITLWPVSDLPVVQVFLKANSPATDAFLKDTTDAFFELQRRCVVIHRAHFTDAAGLRLANEWACADMVDQYRMRLGGVSPDLDEYRSLVADEGCFDFVQLVSEQARATGAALDVPTVYVDGELVADVGEHPDQYRSAVDLAKVLGL